MNGLQFRLVLDDFRKRKDSAPMANRPKKAKRSTLLSELHIPLLILAAFALGAGGMWLIMRTSSTGASTKPRSERLESSPAAEPPNVSDLGPAEAARTLADWNYDRR